MDDTLLKLMTWFSPAFPTGGFAYSSGLEWVAEQGHVHNEAELTDWLETSLAHGALWTEAVLMRLAYGGEDVEALAMALCPSLERQLETRAQGEAFAAASAAWGGTAPGPYPVVVGQLAAAHGISVDTALLAYLHLLVAGQISTAVRLIPLGQSAGLRAQACLEPAISATLARSAGATVIDLGGAAWAADIATMQHETQYTRLFRT